MKKILIIAFGVTVAFSATAQTQKFGHIDSDALMELMPEKAKAEKDMEAFAKEFQGALEAMAKEYEAKVADYQSKEKDMTALVKQTKVKEITDLERRIQEFQGQAQGEIQKKEQELLAPIVEKARKAIDAVATEKGYTYVFDNSSGVLLFAKDSENIIADVKVKLGL
ncbi:MAG: OmpH family outer membrane protein [Flavobacteriales bacterium]|nr:OmpH family outer membrane protein [Flavobacteriales bacterium]